MREGLLERYYILVINPGSTSTKTAVYKNQEVIAEKTICHNSEEITNYKCVQDQLQFRKEAVLRFLEEEQISVMRLSCIVARGGLLLKPVSGGTYLVDETMCQELQNTRQEHASNLGALIASEIADHIGVGAYIVDPIVVDEMESIAKISGMPGIERRSVFHALNQKATGRRTAALLNQDYENSNIIVAHLGGGISVGAHWKGRVVDVNNAVDGDGPFSPERSGGLPVCSLIELCYHSGLSESEINKRIVGRGGLVGYLSTNNAKAVEKMICEGNTKARLIYEAMAYQVAKEIGSCATVLKGKVDAIALTGGMAHSTMLTSWIKERVEFLGPIFVFPGEGEMEALAAGGLRILRGEEQYKLYRTI